MVRLRSTVLGVGLLLAGWQADAQTTQFKEYEVKAAFLFNFAQFIEWPAKAFAGANAPFVVGVLGDDPFGHVLDQTVQGETVNGRRLTLKRSNRLEDLTGCHILFVSRSEKARWPHLFSTLGSPGVLTVGESDQFLRQGGVINFVTTRDNKVRFEINLAAAEQQGLKINAKLLKVAQTVVTTTNAEDR